MNLAFILDPIANLDPTHDSTVAMMEAAQALGYSVWITEAQKLSVRDGKAWAELTQVTLTSVTRGPSKWEASSPWYQLGQKQLCPLETMDCVLMRTDPPVNVPYLYVTYILDYIDRTKTLVLNEPNGLRLANEKMYALNFAEVMPPTLVSQDKAIVAEFLDHHEKIVLKPLGGMAGKGILFVEKGDRNFNSLMEISTKDGTEPIMAQAFLPQAQAGDKRIILLDGKPLGALNRIPTGNEFRGNMAVGGRVEAVGLTDRDREICALVGPRLQRDGLYFVGLDVIGGYLTEVNVTSPTCIREIDFFDQGNLGKELMDWIMARKPRP
jgi:glutathione synthase